MTGHDVLLVGSDSTLAFDAHGRIGDGWVYVVDPRVDALEALLREAHAAGVSGIAYLIGDGGVLPLPDASVHEALVADGAEVAEDELRRVVVTL